ncbi:MAG: trigger factor [Chloroflexi bacterium]|nr:trigger factor [Chloroflexota bacterium]
MKISSERIQDSQVVINVELEPEEILKYEDKAYHRLVNKVRVPGFRKGKTPRVILERFIGKEAFIEDALDNDLSDMYNKAIDEQKIDAIDQPQVEVIKIDPISFKATIPVKPNVELGDYSKIKVEQVKIDVTDIQVQGVIEQIRNMNATWTPVDRKAEFNDLVTIDLEASNEGVVKVNNPGWQLQLLPDSAIPVSGFSEQILGMGKDEEKTFSIIFPSEHNISELAGKDVQFKVKLTEVKEKHLPELNDELAKIAGHDSMELFKQKVLEDLKDKAKQESQVQYEENVVKSVVELAKIEYPPILKKREVDNLIEAQRNQLMSAQIRLEDYLKYVNKTEQELRKELEPVAEKQILGGLVLGKVAELEKIEVTEADIDAETNRLSPEEKGEEFRNFLKTPAARKSLERTIISKKTIDLLCSLASSNVVKPEA